MSGVFILLDSDQTGSGILFLQKARDLGLRPILASERPEKFSWLSEFEHAKLPRMSDEEVLGLARRLAPHLVEGVWSVRDKYVCLAARVARAIGKTAARPEAIEISSDKLKTRQCLAQAGINNVKFAHAQSRDEAARATNDFGGRAIIKPRALTGSIGVRLCRDEEEARLHFDYLAEREPSVRELGVLVEEAIEGPQFSVQIFDGRAIGVTRQDVGPSPAFITVALDFPWLADERVHRDLVRHAEQAIAAVGHTRGPGSVDLRHDDKGPRVLEINPRLAGDMIPENIRLATGIDVVEATIRFACGMAYDLKPRHNRGSATRWFLRPDQPIHDLTGADAASAVSGVTHVRLFPNSYKRTGPATDYRDRLAFVTSEGESPEEAGVIAETGLRHLAATPSKSASISTGTRHQLSFWRRLVKRGRRSLRLSFVGLSRTIDLANGLFSNRQRLARRSAKPSGPN